MTRTTEELKDAAYRVKRCEAGETLLVVYDAESWPLAKIAYRDDCERLAIACLARLAADEQREREDSEPITGRLLAEFGPEKQFGEALFVSANFSVLDATIRVSGVEGDAKGFQICLGELCFITTRGQLRKLLEALAGGGT